MKKKNKNIIFFVFIFLTHHEPFTHLQSYLSCIVTYFQDKEQPINKEFDC